MSVTIDIVVVTRNRPEMIARCLASLAEHVPEQSRVVVVDASDGSQTREITANYPNVEYVYFDNGCDQRPQAKNIGAARCDADVIAFLDDDSVVHAGWMDALAAVYCDDTIGCVGGGIEEPGTEWNPNEPVGRVLPNGDLSQNFATTHKELIDVDHVKGCNMSFRREVFEQLCGFDPGYTGDNIREETDICVGVLRLGKRVVFCPWAVVTHMRAPRETVTRDLADPRKIFYGARNHVYFLLKYYRKDRLKLRTSYLTAVWRQVRWLRPNSSFLPRVWLILVTIAGNISGTFAALTSRRAWAAWRMGKVTS
ncbi:glycosyltransferase [bacterium]|nr:glycosyltransferase [bacterium]